MNEAANKVRMRNKKKPTLGDRHELESRSVRESIKDLEQYSIREFVDEFIGWFWFWFVMMFYSSLATWRLNRILWVFFSSFAT